MGAGISVKEWALSPRQLCDVELILNGGFYPLTGFLGEADYISVLQSMRLDSGKLWPIPITLDVTEKFASSLQPGDIVYLRDQELTPIAELSVSDIWCQYMQPAMNHIQVFLPYSTKRAPIMWGAFNLFVFA